MTLITSINNTLKRISFNHAYVYIKKNKHFSQLGFSKKNTEKTSKELIGSLNELNLEEIIKENNVLTAEFYTKDYSSASLVRPNGVMKLLTNRIRTEIAGMLPFIDLKNSLYKSMGVNIKEGVYGTPTIAPKVFMDYLNPDLVSINEGSVIGEGAKIQAHFFNPGKFVIGEIRIGKRCVIGAGARLLPGTIIKDYSIIGVDSTIYGIVPEKTKINPHSFYKLL